MEDTSNRFCQILFDLLIQKGVRNVVCSPGSRNTPLLLAAAARPLLKKHFVADERSAAFLALGMAMVKKETVALVCTSGTALLNYAPAVAEAFYQGIPLIVISADRPIQWIDQDDSQTLRQNGILNNFVKKSFSIPAYGENSGELQWYVNRISNEAIMEASSGRPGPVHINIHLSEPLNGRETKEREIPRIISSISGDAIANKEVVKDLALKVAHAKVMLIAGFGLPDAHLQKAIADFSILPNVVVMAETISNLHLSPLCYSIDSVLSTLSDKPEEIFKPDIIISIGGALVSRKLKNFLRNISDNCEHWYVGPSNFMADPFMSLTLKVDIPAYRFFRNLNIILRKQIITETLQNYKIQWIKAKENAQKMKDAYIKNCKWSELKAFEMILKNLPSGYNLFLSNGTPVRYAQLIPHTLPHASYCNRGVSGIDGNVSTAIGGAKAYKGTTLLITGDLTMAYDVGALGIKNIPKNFKIIVIDNKGGGIFRFIQSTCSLPEREEYFCQHPSLPLKQLAAGYDWTYFESYDLNSLNSVLPLFFNCPCKAIMKISCPPDESAALLKEYFNS